MLFKIQVFFCTEKDYTALQVMTKYPTASSNYWVEFKKSRMLSKLVVALNKLHKNGSGH